MIKDEKNVEQIRLDRFNQMERAARNAEYLAMIDRGIARHEYEVYYDNEKIGVVTSGGVSPTRGDNIGLAYIKNLDNLTVGSTIQIKIREKLYNAEIVKKPFIDKRNKDAK